MNRLLRSILWAGLLLVGLTAAYAQDSGWPRNLSVDSGMVTIYPLQVDGINGNVIHYRAALAWRPTPQAEPVFGAGWFDSNVAIDQARRIVHPVDLTVTQTRFPEGTEDVQAGLAAALAEQSPAWNLDFSLDELNDALKVAQAEATSALQLNTAPPRIIYRDHPALLVTVDGDPVLREIENSSYKAVINTPYPLIFDGRKYYLNAAQGAWYRADAVTGPWRFEANPPAAIAAMVKPVDAGDAEGPPAEAVTAANAPEIVVSTQPAELIVTEGPAVFVPLVDDLLVLQNSDDDVFMHVGSQQYYIVLAGRWYHAATLNGPWAFQEARQLPPAFANIPDESDQAEARVYVAGTPEAKEAALDAQVPQTAAVTRGQVDIDVNYDGAPDFRPVEGTDMEYAANTGSTVLQSDRRYYLVEDGVWYVSASPNGPWIVSDYRPSAVTAIAPTSPVYNVKYVYIYDSTPDVVYVGYTPGYYGSYVYYGTVVYGTGWYYRPWVSPYYYYPRPSTWGFHVAYNPWGGWSFGLSWGWGPFYANYYSGGYWHHSHYWYHRHYSYWGPRGYRPRPPYYGHRSYGHDRYAYNGYGRDGHAYGNRRYDNRGNDGHGGNYYNYGDRRDNLYRDQRQRATIRDTRDNLPRQYSRGDSVTWQSSKPARREPGNRQVSAPDKAARSRIQPVTSGDMLRKAQVRDATTRARREPGNRQVGAPDKPARSRTQPVTTGDMLRKAQVRDATTRARRNVLMADNSGNVLPGARRNEAQRGPAQQRSSAANGSRPDAGMINRTQPVAAEGPARDNRWNNRRAGENAPNVASQPEPRAARSSARQRQREVVSAPAPQPASRPAASRSAQSASRTTRSVTPAQRQAPQAQAPQTRQYTTPRASTAARANPAGRASAPAVRQAPPQRAMADTGSPRSNPAHGADSRANPRANQRSERRH